jgi:hypothetical protein
MPNYQDSKIYKLVGNAKVYVGSTTQPLCKRKSGHITDYKRGKNMSSREIVSDPNHYIELIEYCPCSTKEELLKRERYYVEQIDCINKCIPGRTIQESQKAYKEANKDKIKAYYETNKDKIKAYYDAYREVNKDKIKSYYETNKDKRKAYQKEYREARKATLNIDVDNIPEPI